MKDPSISSLHGGILVGEVLAMQGVRFLYTLCGGHISPILVGAEAQGIQIVDVRHEATAVFAADATARLTGVPGVAVVTAGPGVTNTITAVKNAQIAQSPLVLIGGATATLLKGRGALQDIDQMTLLKPLVKWAKSVSKVREIVPALEKAFQISQRGVPGPVFVEIPLDLLYPQKLVRKMMGAEAGKRKGVIGRALHFYLTHHLNRTFHGAWEKRARAPELLEVPGPSDEEIQTVVDALQKAQRPLLLIGGQAVVDTQRVAALQEAVVQMGIPAYLSGMARGLLGQDALHMRHRRSEAMKEADLVLRAGLPCDFRLGYGRVISRNSVHVGVNRSKDDLYKNCKPTIGVQCDASAFLRALSSALSKEYSARWRGWHQMLRARDAERSREIERQAQRDTEFVNSIYLCQQIEAVLDYDSLLIGDGGDFVATASYVVQPRSPLSWLDPGAFGTLGTGGGFALAAKLCRPSAEVWMLYGDGSAGYSLAEFDTYARHHLPIIAVVGNDASWAQIAREQVEILGTPLGTELAHTAYHRVAAGYGAVGLCVDRQEAVEPTLRQAKQIASEGQPVLVNVMIGKTDFRKGSISL